LPPVEEILATAELLREAMGAAPRKALGDPVGGLVLAILSQNTNDRNRDLAFRRLRGRFRSWEEVAEASPREVEEAISVAGLFKVKASRILSCLKSLKSHEGRVSLDHLRALSMEQAQDELLGFPGVGVKTARCVLLFEFGLPAFPVDTHVLRVCKRLGWLPPGASADKAHELLQGEIPPDLVYSLHLHLIQVGRLYCRPRSPRCEKCPVRPRCAAFKRAQILPSEVPGET
jgi:endonuclease-3